MNELRRFELADIDMRRFKPSDGMAYPEERFE